MLPRLAAPPVRLPTAIRSLCPWPCLQEVEQRLPWDSYPAAEHITWESGRGTDRARPDIGEAPESLWFTLHCQSSNSGSKAEGVTHGDRELQVRPLSRALCTSLAASEIRRQSSLLLLADHTLSEHWLRPPLHRDPTASHSGRLRPAVCFQSACSVTRLPRSQDRGALYETGTWLPASLLSLKSSASEMQLVLTCQRTVNWAHRSDTAFHQMGTINAQRRSG